jgi:hypothetical protein
MKIFLFRNENDLDGFNLTSVFIGFITIILALLVLTIVNIKTFDNEVKNLNSNIQFYKYKSEACYSLLVYTSGILYKKDSKAGQMFLDRVNQINKNAFVAGKPLETDQLSKLSLVFESGTVGHKSDPHVEMK